MSVIFSRGDLWVKIPDAKQRSEFVSLLSDRFTDFSGFSLRPKPNFIVKHFTDRWDNWSATLDLVSVDARGKKTTNLVPEDFLRKSSVFLIVSREFIQLLEQGKWAAAADHAHSVCKIRAVPFHATATIRFSSLSYFMANSFTWPTLTVDQVTKYTGFPNVAEISTTPLWSAYHIYAGFLSGLGDDLRRTILSNIDATASIFAHGSVAGSRRAPAVGGKFACGASAKTRRVRSLLSILGCNQEEFAEIAVRRENMYNIIGGTPSQKAILTTVNAISSPCDTTYWLFIRNRQMRRHPLGA